MITCHAAVVEHDLDPGLSDLKEGCSFPSALSRLHGEGQDGPPQKWEPRRTSAPGELSPSCYLSSRLPVLSPLRKAEGGDKGAEVLMGHVTPRCLWLHRQPHPPRGLAWVECRKEGSGDGQGVGDGQIPVSIPGAPS